jgi:hypothetical protein
MRAITTVGTNSTTPIIPTAIGERVSAYIWNGSATYVIADPNADTNWPKYIKQNSGERSGVMSGRRERKYFVM